MDANLKIRKINESNIDLCFKKSITKSDVQKIVDEIELIEGNFWMVITKSIHSDRNYNFLILSRWGDESNYMFDEDLQRIYVMEGISKSGRLSTNIDFIKETNVFPMLSGHNVDVLLQENIGMKWADKLFDRHIKKLMKNDAYGLISVENLFSLMSDADFRRLVRNRDTKINKRDLLNNYFIKNKDIFKKIKNGIEFADVVMGIFGLK